MDEAEGFISKIIKQTKTQVLVQWEGEDDPSWIYWDDVENYEGGEEAV